MCDKQISTEAGPLTCDLKKGHDEAHHAVWKGGPVPFPDQRKSESPTPFSTEKGEFLQAHNVEAFEIEWPHEGMHGSTPVTVRRG